MYKNIEKWSLFPCARSGPILTSLRVGCNIKGYFQGVYCNITDHCFCIITLQYYGPFFHTIYGVVMHTVNSLKITLFYNQPVSDVKIGPGHTHENSFIS